MKTWFEKVYGVPAPVKKVESTCAKIALVRRRKPYVRKVKRNITGKFGHKEAFAFIRQLKKAS